MTLAELRRTKNLFVDGITRAMLRTTHDRMWDASKNYRDRKGLRDCVRAMVALFIFLGGVQNFARILAAAIRDPDVSPSAKANLLAAICRMHLAVETEKAFFEQEQVAAMTDAELAAEFSTLSQSMKIKRGRALVKKLGKRKKKPKKPKRKLGHKPAKPLPNIAID